MTPHDSEEQGRETLKEGLRAMLEDPQVSGSACDNQLSGKYAGLDTHLYLGFLRPSSYANICMLVPPALPGIIGAVGLNHDPLGKTARGRSGANPFSEHGDVSYVGEHLAVELGVQGGATHTGWLGLVRSLPPDTIRKLTALTKRHEAGFSLSDRRMQFTIAKLNRLRRPVHAIQEVMNCMRVLASVLVSMEPYFPLFVPSADSATTWECAMDLQGRCGDCEEWSRLSGPKVWTPCGACGGQRYVKPDTWGEWMRFASLVTSADGHPRNDYGVGGSLKALPQSVRCHKCNTPISSEMPSTHTSTIECTECGTQLPTRPAPAWLKERAPSAQQLFLAGCDEVLPTHGGGAQTALEGEAAASPCPDCGGPLKPTVDAAAPSRCQYCESLAGLPGGKNGAHRARKAAEKRLWYVRFGMGDMTPERLAALVSEAVAAAEAELKAAGLSVPEQDVSRIAEIMPPMPADWQKKPGAEREERPPESPRVSLTEEQPASASPEPRRRGRLLLIAVMIAVVVLYLGVVVCGGVFSFFAGFALS